MFAPVVFCIGVLIAFVVGLLAMYSLNPAVGLGIYVLTLVLTVVLTIRTART